MNLPNAKFCVLPWISLEASPIGTVRPCCLADHELTDNAGEKFNLNTATFSIIQNSHDMRRLRQQFINGDEPETCRKCWNEERSGRTSKRMHTLDRLKHMLPDQEWTTDAKPLMFLDLKLGNICNLKCRICGSWSSSTFATEELQSLSPGEDRKSNYHYQMLRAGAWPRENPIFWKEIDQVVDQIQYIEFTGGEPFMIKEHFDLLRKLVDRGLAHNIELHYNTNGTQWPQGAEDIWRNFQHVEIAFSIDDVEQRFEYQRTGADWNNVNYNLQLFQEMRARNSNISLQVCCTVNIFNVLYLPMVAQWIEPQGFDFVYWNMLHDAPQHCIANLPESVKNKIAEHLKQSQFSEVYKKDIQGVIDFMFSRPGTDEKDLIKNIRTLDQRRSESLRTVAPELAEILNYD